jgi:parvulin-like peptidyl-prolyl isomerase
MTRPPNLALVLLVLLVAGCPRKPAAPKGQPLALLGDQVLVTSDELEAELRNRSPTIPSGPIDAEAKRELLDKLVQFALLVREAEQQGLQNDPEVQRQHKKAMLNVFVQHVLDQDPRAAPDTDAELQALYEKHKGEYAKSARLHLLVIELPAGEGAGIPPAVTKAAAELKARGDSASAFSALAREISTDARTRSKGGDSDWAVREDLIARYGDSVVLVAEKLQPNQTSEPVRGKDGWFLVQLAGKQDAVNPTFEQLKPVLKARSHHDKRSEVARAYEDDLRKRSHVEIDEEALAKIDPMHLGDEKK